eukprot:GHVS01031464.1.p1 GENE.GHVS01031464.1~~GHVS01031464.1.p1  ORF type:complete len:524 (-),score=112.23 GHVS01031464.1:753-2324(-)
MSVMMLPPPPTYRNVLFSLLLSLLCILQLFARQTQTTTVYNSQQPQINQSQTPSLIYSTTTHSDSSRHSPPPLSTSYSLVSSLTSPFGYRWDLLGSAVSSPHNIATLTTTYSNNHYLLRSLLPTVISHNHHHHHSVWPSHSKQHNNHSHASVLLSFVRPAPPPGLPLLSVPLLPTTSLTFGGRLKDKQKNGCSSSPCHHNNSSIAAHNSKWNYSSHGLDWSTPSFPCGKHQSPIHINPANVRVSKQLVEFDYSKTIDNYKVVNNGHSVQVDALTSTGFGFLSLDRHHSLFRVRQFHFHAPAEHSFGRSSPPAADGKTTTNNLRRGDHKAVLLLDEKYNRRDLELHIVHTPDDGTKGSAAAGRVVVVGVTFVPSTSNTPNAFLASVLSAIKTLSQTKNNQKDKQQQTDLIGLENLFFNNNNNDKVTTTNDVGPPRSVGMFRYEGSLTTPPLTEGVTWLLLDSPLEASLEQLTQMREALLSAHGETTGNYRIIQNSPLVNNNQADVVKVFAHPKSSSVVGNDTNR